MSYDSKVHESGHTQKKHPSWTGGGGISWLCHHQQMSEIVAPPLITSSIYYFFGKKYFEYLMITSSFLNVSLRVSAHYVFLTFLEGISSFSEIKI